MAPVHDDFHNLFENSISYRNSLNLSKHDYKLIKNEMACSLFLYLLKRRDLSSFTFEGIA